MNRGNFERWLFPRNDYVLVVWHDYDNNIRKISVTILIRVATTSYQANLHKRTLLKNPTACFIS